MLNPFWLNWTKLISRTCYLFLPVFSSYRSSYSGQRKRKWAALPFSKFVGNSNIVPKQLSKIWIQAFLFFLGWSKNPHKICQVKFGWHISALVSEFCKNSGPFKLTNAGSPLIERSFIKTLVSNDEKRRISNWMELAGNTTERHHIKVSERDIVNGMLLLVVWSRAEGKGAGKYQFNARGRRHSR